MLVKLEELEIGDEILIPCQVDFKRLKLLKKPVLRPAGWNEGSYKAVQCEIYNINKDKRAGNWNAYSPEDKYNDKVSIDLNCRHIWLIKKAELC
jgi:hypothetical protein